VSIDNEDFFLFLWLFSKLDFRASTSFLWLNDGSYYHAVKLSARGSQLVEYLGLSYPACRCLCIEVGGDLSPCILWSVHHIASPLECGHPSYNVPV